jgi:effector-binding domain-containing protein
MMPEATYTVEGPDYGVGASMTWTEPGPSGEQGRQTIVASTPYERVDMEVELGSGEAAQSRFILRPENGGTRVTWEFDIDFGINILARFYGLFLERQLGPLHAQGLVNLERIVKALPSVDWCDLDIQITEVESRTIAYVTGSAEGTTEDIANALAGAYGRVVAFVATNGLQLTGQPVAITNYRDERGWGFDAGLPVSSPLERGVGTDSAVRMGETYGGPVVKAVHVGPYEGLQQTSNQVEAFITVHHLERNGRPWDVFISDPANTPEDQLITEVYYPVK